MSSHNSATFEDILKWQRLQGSMTSKTANSKFKRKSNIPVFSFKLKNLMKELSSTGDDETVKLIGSNHVVTDLEPLFKETVKLLKLSTNTRLESLLELIRSKVDAELCNIGMKTTFTFAATSVRTHSNILITWRTLTEQGSKLNRSVNY